jgi:hypothetical protein
MPSSSSRDDASFDVGIRVGIRVGDVVGHVVGAPIKVVRFLKGLVVGAVFGRLANESW